MYINKFKECELSALGMGTMRLPLNSDDQKDIDIEKAGEVIAYGLSHGINYIDLAYGYHDGVCEEVMGSILKDYPRDSYYLADKFPGYIEELAKKPQEVFETQLKRTGAGYFDFYLLHAVMSDNVDSYLDPEYGVIDYLLEEKSKGRIKHLGFSCHISPEGLEDFLSKRGSDMEFCQIQLNWLDWTVQDAKRKVEILRQFGLPIWVMEPVRGGKLVRLASEDAAKLKELRPEAATVEWCFRFLQSIPEVKMVLSGMNSIQQITDNVRYHECRESLNAKEMNTITGIGERMSRDDRVLCTACRYCAPHCPMKLDIPGLIRLYNELSHADGDPGAAARLEALSEEEKPHNCIGCGTCTSLCPQGIKVSEVLKKL